MTIACKFRLPLIDVEFLIYRSAVRAAAIATTAATAATHRSRSRSRSRARQGNAAAGTAAPSNGRQKGAGVVGARRRGRSLQRTGGKIAKGINKNGNKKKKNQITEGGKANQQQQGRRGRSRGRGGRTVAGKSVTSMAHCTDIRLEGSA